MTYASIAILAIITQTIINQDVLKKKTQGMVTIPAQDEYRRFLFATFAYYLTDALWGILDSLNLTPLLYADTVVYFIAMAGGVFLWTQFVIKYLEEKNGFTDFLLYSGQLFLAFEIVALIINFFYPSFFYFAADGSYHACPVRYIALMVQIVLFLFTSLNTFFIMMKSQGAVKRRNRTVAFFGIIMVVLIFIQYFYPLLPIYSIGYMIGCCLLHTFVIEDVKREYRMELEESLKREKEQKAELGSAKRLAYTDSLTGVKSKHAYIEKEELVDQLINDQVAGEFGIVVFDLNGLKKINDTKGHEVGDEYIIAAAKLICDHFKHSPIYRIGGDEFVAYVCGDDYVNRVSILGAFDMRIEKNLRSDKVVVATGLADFNPEHDNSFRNVFERADSIMYQRKRLLKHMVAV